MIIPHFNNEVPGVSLSFGNVPDSRGLCADRTCIHNHNRVFINEDDLHIYETWYEDEL